MDKGILKAIWGGMYILCGVLGFVQQSDGFSYWLMVFCSVAFFVPPALLLWQAKKERDAKTIRLVGLLSVCSLGLTLVLLVANFLTIWSASLGLGDALFVILQLGSVPMICSQNWVISLFLWASLQFYRYEKR